jgi:hypothetical protein
VDRHGCRSEAAASPGVLGYWVNRRPSPPPLHQGERTWRAVDLVAEIVPTFCQHSALIGVIASERRKAI